MPNPTPSERFRKSRRRWIGFLLVLGLVLAVVAFARIQANDAARSSAKEAAEELGQLGAESRRGRLQGKAALREMELDRVPDDPAKADPDPDPDEAP